MYNYAIQNQGIIAWDGAAGAPVDIRHHIGFGWTLQVMVDLANDTIFNIKAAPASPADPCLPDAWYPVAEIVICDRPAVPQPQATILLPAGTTAGSICTATLPCKPDAFVLLEGAGGDVGSVRGVAILSGPK